MIYKRGTPPRTGVLFRGYSEEAHFIPRWKRNHGFESSIQYGDEGNQVLASKYGY
ncbi:MAG: hypothetical protein QUT30_03835 [Acidobacteriota bacterium]|nr:hypothetical protein [Acidobacteriota bacterium]